MADETTKVDLATAHPELEENHRRMRSLVLEIRDRKRRGEALPAELRSEVDALALWAETLAAEAVGDLAAFQARVDRDRAAFALALRLGGDELLARQLLMAAADLRAEV